VERYPSRRGTYSTNIWRGSFFGLGGLGLAPVPDISDTGDLTVSPSGTPVSSPGYLPPSHTTDLGSGRGPIDFRLRYVIPPPECVLGSVSIAQTRLPSDVLPDFFTDSDLPIVLAALASSERQRLDAIRASWKAQFPWAADPGLKVSYTHMGRPDLDKVTIWAMRPPGYDPILTAQPAIPPGTDHAKIFSAAFGMFFPEKLTPDAYRQFFSKEGSKAGSIIGDGPFPYWVKMITAAQVQAVARYTVTEPNAFGLAPAVGSDHSILMDALQHGLAAGAGTGNPYVAAGAAVATAIWEGLTSLFDGPPSTPVWYTHLVQTAQGRPGDFGTRLLGISNVGGQAPCQRSWIHSGGDFTIFEAFDAVVRTLGGPQGGATGKSWLWIVLGAAAASLVGT
jgi:hypothetical protein